MCIFAQHTGPKMLGDHYVSLNVDCPAIDEVLRICARCRRGWSARYSGLTPSAFFAQRADALIYSRLSRFMQQFCAPTGRQRSWCFLPISVLVHLQDAAAEGAGRWRHAIFGAFLPSRAEPSSAADHACATSTIATSSGERYDLPSEEQNRHAPLQLAVSRSRNAAFQRPTYRRFHGYYLRDDYAGISARGNEHAARSVNNVHFTPR